VHSRYTKLPLSTHNSEEMERETTKKTKLLKKKHPLVIDRQTGKSKLGNKAEADSETGLTRAQHRYTNKLYTLSYLSVVSFFFFFCAML